MGKESEKKKYYVVKERAVPEVLIKVVEAKKLLDMGKVETVQDATEQVGISRSSFISIRMISFLSTRRLEERLLPLSSPWMMSRDCCPVCCK